MPKTTTLIVWLLIIAVLCASYFILKPQYNKLTAQKTQVQEKEQILKNKQKTLEDLKILEENYKQAKAKVKDIPDVLPSKQQIPELVVQLEALARENNMAFSSVSVTPQQEEGAVYNSLKISCACAGSYSNLKNYLDSVEKNMRIMDITSIDFSATPLVEGGPIDVFSYTVNMKTYYIE